MNKKWVMIAVIPVVLFAVLLVSRSQPTTEPPPIASSGSPKLSTDTTDVTPQPADFTAAFAIYTNGTFRVFTASMYHNRSPDVYIETANPNLVRVKKSGVTWQEFFDTLPFKLTPDCLTTGTGETFCTSEVNQLAFYLNGVNTSDALSREIKPRDQLLVHYGKEDIEIVQQELEKLKSLTP